MSGVHRELSPQGAFAWHSPEGALLRGPMLLVAGGVVPFFVKAMLVTLLTVRSVLVHGGASLSVTFVSLFLGLR